MHVKLSRSPFSPENGPLDLGYHPIKIGIAGSNPAAGTKREPKSVGYHLNETSHRCNLFTKILLRVREAWSSHLAHN